MNKLFRNGKISRKWKQNNELPPQKEVLYHLQGRISKRRQRIHADAAADNATRLRALEGLCGGGCDGLKLNFLHKDGKDRVALGCSKGYSPSALYGNTPPGEKASCVGYPKEC